MENKIYSQENYELIIKNKKKITKQIIIASIIYFALVIIFAILFIVNNSTLFMVISTLLSITVTIFILFLVLIKLKRLNSYQSLYNEIKRYSLEQLEGKVLRKSNGIRTVNELGFIEYTVSLTSDHRKERIILIDENLNVELEVGKVYTCTLSNTYLVDIKDIDIQKSNLDYKVTPPRIKNSISYNWYLYFGLSFVLFIGLYFTEFYVNKPSEEEQMRVWLDRPSLVSSSMVDKFKEAGTNFGYKQTLIYEYYPQDTTNYSNSFSTVGLFSTDIYMLFKDNDDEKKDIIEQNQDMLFMDISLLEIEDVEYYEYNGKKLGIKYGEYYIFARENNNKSNQELKQMIEAILSVDYPLIK